MVKYLITDMDHTLLQEDGELDDITIRTIRQSPIQVSLASARNPYSMIKYVQQLQLSGPHLAMNGSIIFQVTNDQIKLLQKKVINRRLSLMVQQFLNQNYPDIDFTWITADHWYIPKMTPEMKEEMQYSGVQPVIGQQLVNTAEPCQIVLIIKDQTRFQQVQAALRSKFGDHQLTVRSSGDGYLTINPCGVNKGTLVKYLINEKEISRSVIAGVGDDQNDLPLLAAVGHPLAVNNAVDSVKEMADQIIPGNQEDGIAQYLQQFSH
ncbi:HAD family hydrolase [Limosilactobacillus coleohominis]|uniref:HAD family hydrolase n=1 Tax=Limosilactobacillus coleohominis TaxID=181675 RepID=A0ABS2GYQ8_9LACO|nr:HAD family hydrolase [Limosilactobacillus coleohominis]MBM6940409.1 HAD family hydrolase [Limosilactobacillus coleohominis]